MRALKIKSDGQIEITSCIQTAIFISPTHKRTEGRAPVWSSEFTSKDAALQGGVGGIAARLNVKMCDLVTD
jgi:hypothetical protein